MPKMGYTGISSRGCLLPGLIIFNLFFGRLFFKSFSLWLGVEGILVLIFLLQIKLLVGRINKLFSSAQNIPASLRSQEKVVDIQGQVVEDNQKTLKQ